MSQQREEASLDPVKFRKTRIVCLSDTHNALPKNGCFKLPAGDVLVHAGDLTNQGTLQELQRTVEWIANADYEVKIVVAGNHDITLDKEYYAHHGARFHNQYPQSSEECISLVSEHPSIIYLNHSASTIRLSRASGPRTHFTVFGSPYSPGDGSWAFGYDASGRRHQPGYSEDEIDEDKGTQAALPSSTSPDDSNAPWDAIPDNADIVITHTPPAGLCDAGRLDRSCAALRRALERARPKLAVCGHIHEGWGAEMVAWQQAAVGEPAAAPVNLDLPKAGNKQARIDLTSKRLWMHEKGNPNDSVSERRTNSNSETCVVNAAIMASSRGSGSKGQKYNKPIVVDVDLPIWLPD